MKYKKKSIVLLSLLLTICLIGCVKARSELVVTPTLYVYSNKFQTKVNAELKKTSMKPCTRGDVSIECSALYRIALDYLHVRNQIRAIKESIANAK